NYLADNAGETVMQGGTGPDWELSPSGSMILNSLYNHPERLLGTKSLNPSWYANTVVFTGRCLKGGSYWWQAQNSGTTGATQPAWCTPANPQTQPCTTNDNGVLWKTVSNSSGTEFVLKNLYESKNSKDVVNAWNQYRGYTNQAQVQAVVYKLSNYPPANGVR